MNTNTASFRIGISIALLWLAVSGYLVWRTYQHDWPPDAYLEIDADACDGEIRSRLMDTNRMMQPEIQRCVRAKAEAKLREDRAMIADRRSELKTEAAWHVVWWCVVPIAIILFLASLGSGYLKWIWTGKRR